MPSKTGIRILTLWVLGQLVLASPLFGFRSTARWSSTAIDGSGMKQGDPTNLTWSFVPDGTPLADGGTSSLISALDSTFGAGEGTSDLTQRPWFSIYEQSFQRWSELAGLSYTYEPNDDGLLQGTNIINGSVGFRGDIRIAGKNVDGESNVLAFNYFPSSGGDMVYDVADMGLFAIPNNNFRSMRNVTMHEHGHGLGILHLDSDNGAFLMEPFYDVSIDGPQFDDILTAQRSYGDFFEKSNNMAGNETALLATSLGMVNDGETVKIGAAGRNIAVAADATDFVSIDGILDVDYFSFQIDNPALVDITLVPVGPSYLEGPQNGDQSLLRPSRFNDLSLQFFDKDGTTQLGVTNAGGLGETESLTDLLAPTAGEYFVRIQGEFDTIQMFELSISIEEQAPQINVDFNDDGLVDCADIDALVMQIATAGGDLLFDLTGDGNVDAADLDQWLADAGEFNGLGGAYLPGDANLDGFVDVSDFNVWNSNRLTFMASWCMGDFNADGAIDVADFNRWNSFRLSSSGSGVVPEPQALLPFLAALLPLFVSRLRAGGTA